MKPPLSMIVVVAAGFAVSGAIAQPAYVGGILYEPAGSASLGAVSGRVLSVGNIGSSGEDGVAVRCSSAWGGGVGVDLTGFGGVGANREIKIRPKGWDGTVKGTMRAYNEPATGVTYLAADFSDSGAAGASYVEYDELGNAVAEGLLPAEGLAMGPCPGQYQIWYASLHLISLGPPKQFTVTWHYYCSNCPDPWQWFAPCGGISSARTIVVTPIFPGGVPGISDVDALVVTGRDLPDLDGDGVPDLVVGNADIKSFPIPCPPWDCLGPDYALDSARWGLGQAQISEQCTPDSMGGCDPSIRRLVVDNLGSSGQDGVAVALPPNNGGVSVELAKGNCCRGHVIIMKAFDDEGHEQRVSMTQTTDLTGIEELDADFSSLGAIGFRLRLFGPGGVVLGPPEGTAFYAGGPKPTFTNMCPPGYREIWVNQGTPANPVWVFSGCEGLYEFTLPGIGTVPGVASFSVEPIDATSSFGQRTRVEVLSDDDQGLVITGITVTPATTAYVSGLLHTALGTAQLDPPTDRRLPVRNLGSSGEDGVEIQLHSLLGGGAEVDLEPFLSTPGATLRHKYKGWDGLIYGNHRLASNGDGSAMLTLDYSDVGATSIVIEQLDANGVVISSAEYTGPIVDLPLNEEEFVCPPGCTKTMRWWEGQLCSTCPVESHWVFTCTCPGGGGSTDYTERVITPTFPPGTPDTPGFESLSITGSGLSELVVSNANVRTFGLPSWGLGASHLGEQCTPDGMGGCDETDRRLVVTNIGSSGQDGVAIDVPKEQGGVSLSLAKGNCCRGHVIIMKAYDDEGQVQRIITTQASDSSGTEELDADFTDLGASGYILTAYGPGGVVIGPPGGTEIVNGGPKVVVGTPCPPGSNAIWQNNGTQSNPVWVFVGCLGIPIDLIVPGVGPLVGVTSFDIKPLNPTSSVGRLVRLEVVSDDPEGLIIEDISVSPGLKGDLNCDGVANFKDINPFVLRLANPATYAGTFPNCPSYNADINNNGVVGFDDINPFVALLSSGR
ncbi:MAG: hypothetical protein KA383_15120 [Phycisphaerae bacterium]|nr:hypothetical protein [Phycisphaerae bacterium]